MAARIRIDFEVANPPSRLPQYLRIVQSTKSLGMSVELTDFQRAGLLPARLADHLRDRAAKQGASTRAAALAEQCVVALVQRYRQAQSRPHP